MHRNGRWNARDNVQGQATFNAAAVVLAAAPLVASWLTDGFIVGGRGHRLGRSRTTKHVDFERPSVIVASLWLR